MTPAKRFLAARLQQPAQHPALGSRGRNVSRGRPLSTVALLTSLLLLASGLSSAVVESANASSISTLQAKAAAIASQVDAANVKLEILAEEYDEANIRSTSLQEQIVATKQDIAAINQSIQKDNANIAAQAVGAYVSGNSQNGILPAANPNDLPSQQTYLQAAAGNLSAAISALQNDEHRLSDREATLTVAETQAAAATTTIDSAKSSAAGVESDLNGELQGVNAQLAPLVAQQEAAQQAAAAAAAAAEAQQAAGQSSSTQSTGNSGAGAPITTTSPSAGLAAVAAAKTQLGVPYVWGGATPGSGFDCSGLAMWAWAQAGVTLPHSAQSQYDSIPHVSLSSLEPGDLIFYASDGYIYHVIMYIGGGQAIQAEDYGIPVTITPVWSGAYGAGRP